MHGHVFIMELSKNRMSRNGYNYFSNFTLDTMLERNDIVRHHKNSDNRQELEVQNDWLFPSKVAIKLAWVKLM